MDFEAFENALISEIHIFQDGQEYNFVEDLRSGFDEGLREPMAKKIFDTLPDHVFYDIKKPLIANDDSFWNKYNPARAHPNSSFFEMRSNADYHMRQTKK